MANPNKARNSEALSTTTATPREQTRDSIHRKFRVHFQEPAKVIGRKIGQSAATVDLYRQQNVPQSWAAFAEACRANPHFALDILEDLGIDLDHDRYGYAQFIAMKRAAMQGK